MNIGILGSGNVGQTLGAGCAALGESVMIGSRTPEQEKLTKWLEKTSGEVQSGTFEETAVFADLAILATSWVGTQNALKLAGAKNLADKVVIDAVNPLDFSNGFPPTLAVGHTDSAGEQIQRWLPKAHVVKAFNIVGLDHMVNPDFDGGPPDMFICGNSKQAKEKVTDLLARLGWVSVDMGGIEAARYLEPMAMGGFYTPPKVVHVGTLSNFCENRANKRFGENDE